MTVDLVIEIPAGRRAEREYALSAVLGGWMSRTYELAIRGDARETRIRLGGASEGRALVVPDVLLSSSTDWLSSQSLPRPPLPVVDVNDDIVDGGRLPLLFAAADEPARILSETPDDLRFEFDVLGALFFLLSRYEEYVEPVELDAHGRFPARRSILWPDGWLRHPLADAYALSLDAAMRRLWPGLAPMDRGSGAVLSHDIDHPSSAIRWRGRQRLKVIAADLLKRRDPGLAAHRAAAFAPLSSLARHDPYEAFAFLMGVSERTGRRSTFFAMTKDTALPDTSDYSIGDRRLARILRDIADRGHGIGLHGSYLSYADTDRLTEEWRLLEEACSSLAEGALRPAVRQHFLMFRPGVTWSAQAAAGFTLDETLGFSDEVGFRAGTARTFPAFDIRSGRSLPIVVRPLHAMDVAMLVHMGLDSTGVLEAVSGLARSVRHSGGRLSLLWHNSSLETRRARRLYEEAVFVLPT